MLVFEQGRTRAAHRAEHYGVPNILEILYQLVILVQRNENQAKMFLWLPDCCITLISARQCSFLPRECATVTRERPTNVNVQNISLVNTA